MDVREAGAHRRTLSKEGGRAVLAVLGGTSVGTPALIGALARARQAGRLPDLELRLFGRALARGERLIDYAAATIPGAGRGPEAQLRLRLAPGLGAALPGADIVLSQIRPGGMAARAEDELMALAEGVPGDEGLGPAGLASFLRGRPLMDRIAEAHAVLAPEAVLLQLTSPLGLTVARAARRTGRTVLGLCELPATTWAALRRAAEPGLGPLRRAHFGLNHQAWLYAFTDAQGVDRTLEVIAAADPARLVGIEPEIARRAQAVPVAYLRLLYHQERELLAQRARRRTRGGGLMAWTAELEAAYLRPGGPALGRIARLLARRPMGWYEDAVVPALAAVCGGAGAELVLNLTGVLPEIAVELPCRLAGRTATPLPQPPLPPEPAALFRRLAAYERAALALPDRPRPSEIARVLALHPMVAEPALAERLARRIAARLPEPVP